MLSILITFVTLLEMIILLKIISTSISNVPSTLWFYLAALKSCLWGNALKQFTRFEMEAFIVNSAVQKFKAAIFNFCNYCHTC